jgi:hypothetical protein
MLMAFHEFKMDDSDENAADNMRQFFGPLQIDRQIRQAIQFCWLGLPKEQQNVDEVERQIHRIVERALRDLRDDSGEFFGKEGSK